jgi:hypothetical protein
MTGTLPWRRPVLAATLVLILGMTAVAYLPTPERSGSRGEQLAPVLLPTVHALPFRMDTLFLGGYARGSFSEALQTIASDLSAAERTLVGRHLDRIFAGVLDGEDLVRGGRLRLVCERSVRPDGSTRSIRVLAAEAAVGGRMYSAFFFAHGERPGYFDASGRPLDSRAWLRPLAGSHVTSAFHTQRWHPILRQVLPHPGVDYAAVHGTPVRASADGSVSAAEWRGGYGNLVEIQHANGYTTRYAHLSRLEPGIERGAYLRRGEVVGRVGSTGLATGAHLHFGVRHHGRPVEPEAVLGEPSQVVDLPFDLAWSAERRKLAQLLARAPRTLTRSPAPER